MLCCKYNNKMKNITLFLLSSYFAFIFISPAHAYLDPGTVSIVLQSILAAIAGIVATYKMWIFKIKNFLKKKKPNKEP